MRMTAAPASALPLKPDALELDSLVGDEGASSDLRSKRTRARRDGAGDRVLA